MNQLVHIIQTPPFWLKTPPLSLIYLKTYLKNQGISVTVSDLNLELFKLMQPSLGQWLSLNKDFETKLFSKVEKQYPQLLNKLCNDIGQTQYIGFSLFKRNFSFAFSLAKLINKRFSNKTIIFGGPHTLFLDKEGTLDENYYWVIGEGEKPLLEIANGSQNKIYRFQELDNLDDLKTYDFSPLKSNQYSKTLPLLSSRGCPYQCNFCSERLLYKKFRYHSPQYIIEQIRSLQSKYKTTNFVFLDSLINYKHEWLYDFCSLVIKNNLNIKWEAQIRIEKNFSLQLAKLLKESGCYNLFVGLESGCDKVLELMNKGFTASCAVDFFKILKAAQLHFEISLIFGYPGEGKKEFQETLSFISGNKKLIPKIAQANPFTDYFDDFLDQPFLKGQTKKKIEIFLKILEEEKIKYTRSFINNLTYPCA